MATFDTIRGDFLLLVDAHPPEADYNRSLSKIL
jgi:hypothetical protein